MKKDTLKIFALALWMVLPVVTLAQEKSISGYVYVDTNRNKKFDKEETALEHVLVSNGRDVVATNKKGKYTLPLFDETTIFVIKPKGYLPPLSEDQLPQAYALHKPLGSPDYMTHGIEPTVLPDTLNFPMYPNKQEETLKIGLLGDTQTKYKDEVFYVGKLVGEQLIDEQFDFVVPLGDIVDDELALMEPIRQTLGKIGAVVYPVMGNHDRNYKARSLQHSDDTFKKTFGPSYYAFHYGANAFVVLDDIYPDTTGTSRKYEGRIDDRQMAFIRNYLAHVDPATHIYLMMHIPLEYLKNLEELLALFEKHPNVSAFAGHTHTQYYLELDQAYGWPHEKPLTELVAGAVCGSWWHGEKDSYGVPTSLMKDGTPKGYWVMHIAGNSEPTFEYKLSGNVPNKQMHIWTPYPFKREQVFFTDPFIIANVYAGNEETKVEVLIEGQQDWMSMEKVLELDPYYTRLIELRKQDIPTEANIRAFGTTNNYMSRHLWKVPVPELKKGVYWVKVRAANPYGLNAASKTLLYVE